MEIISARILKTFFFLVEKVKQILLIIISWEVKLKSLSHVRLFVTSWTVAYQAPPSMGFSRQEYWSGLPFPSPGDLPDPGIEPVFLAPALAGGFFAPGPPGKLNTFQ